VRKHDDSYFKAAMIRKKLRRKQREISLRLLCEAFFDRANVRTSS